jgi:putative spermidine/putrescine transport system substrate-binding protein
MVRKSKRRGAAHRALVAAAVAVGLVTFSACGAGSSDGNGTGAAEKVDSVLPMPDLKGQTIVINTYGGTFETAFTKEVVTPFEQATGADVKLVTTCCDGFSTTVEKNQYAGDLVLGNDYGPMLLWSDNGLLQKDDRIAKIAEARGVDKNYYQDDLLAVDFYAYVLAWNTDRVKSPPANWADFYDTTAFPGVRGISARPGGSMETALLAQGATADDLYPLDTGAAIDGLRELRDSKKLRFWANGADLTNKLGTGEFDYTMGFSNRIAQAKDSGLPIDYTFDGSILAASAAAIPKGAKNVDGAIAFLDFYFQPDIQADFAKISALAPAYESANEQLSDDEAVSMVTSTENLPKTVRYDDRYWQKNYEANAKDYTEFVTGE